MSDGHPAKLDASGDQQEPTGGASGSEQEPTGGASGDQQEPTGGASGSEQEPTGGASGSQQKPEGLRNPGASGDEQEPMEDESCGGQNPIADTSHSAFDCEREPNGKANNGASSGEQKPNSGASDGEREPNGSANSGASGGEQEPKGSANSGASGEQEPKGSANLGTSGREQEPTEDASSNAFRCELERTRDASNSEQEPKGNTSPATSITAQVSTGNVNLHVPGGTQIPMRGSNPDPSSGIEVSLEGSRLPPDGSVEVEMEDVSTDASKQTTEGNVEESSSPIASGSIASTSKKRQRGKDHICSDICIHGGARPKIRKQMRVSAINPDVSESSSDSNEIERTLENLHRLVERMGRDLAQNPPDGNISQEEWKEKLESANCLTEEFSEQLGYRPIVQMPDNTRSPSLQSYGQLDRMFLSLSLDVENKSETKPCILSRRASNPYQEASARRDAEEELGDQNPGSSVSGRIGLEEGQSEDHEIVSFPWPDPIKNAQVKAEEQDFVHKDKKEEVLQEPDPNQDEKMEVLEPDLDQDDDKMEVVEDQDPINQDQGIEGVEERMEDPQQPVQEYRLMRLAPVLPPANQVGIINPNPNHPYHLRELDLWRAAMMTAYKSERYHSNELLDHTMEQLEAEGVSRDEFYRLYHSTRLIDFYRDEGIDEARTSSELHDMYLEDRINRIIMAVGYMTVAMLYMRLYADANPQVNDNSSESSTFDSGNIDSSESEPKVEYVPLREHVNIEIDDIISTDPSSENSSSQVAINSPGNANSPEGILSPDLVVPPNSNESIVSNKEGISSILLPLSEISKRSDASSSQKSLLSDGNMSDTDSSSSQPISSSQLYSSTQSTSSSFQSHSSSPQAPPPSPQAPPSSPQAPPSSPQSQSSSSQSQSSSSQSQSSSSQSQSSSSQSQSSSSQSQSSSSQSQSSSSQSQSSSSPQAPPSSPQSQSSSSPQAPPSSPQAPPSSPQSRFSSPRATPSTSQVPSSRKFVKRDDLKRQAILRSCRSLSRDSPSRDATPVLPDERNVNEDSTDGSGAIQTVGDLLSLVINAIFARYTLDLQATQAQGSGSDSQRSNSEARCKGVDKNKGEVGLYNQVEGQRKEGSVNQARDQAEGSENQDQVEGEKDLDGDQAQTEVENKQGADDEDRMKKETEAADAKSQAEDEGKSECVVQSEKKAEGEGEAECKDHDENQGNDDVDFHMEVSKTERDKKRKDHSDSDDEFQQLPKRPHIEN